MTIIDLDLRNEKCFEDDCFSIDKNLTFIFGQNGTGKSIMDSNPPTNPLQNRL